MARVLLVDDDIAEISAVKRVLARAGHPPVLATNTSDAGTAIAQSPPDLLLVSTSCEGGEALAFARRLADDPATADVALVFLGEVVDPPPGARVVPRPIDPQQLTEDVKALLAGRPARPPVAATWLANAIAVSMPKPGSSPDPAPAPPARPPPSATWAPPAAPAPAGPVPLPLPPVIRLPSAKPAVLAAPGHPQHAPTPAFAEDGADPSAARRAAAEALRARAEELRRAPAPAEPAAGPGAWAAPAASSAPIAPTAPTAPAGNSLGLDFDDLDALLRDDEDRAALLGHSEPAPVAILEEPPRAPPPDEAARREAEALALEEEVRREAAARREARARAAEERARREVEEAARREAEAQAEAQRVAAEAEARRRAEAEAHAAAEEDARRRAEAELASVREALAAERVTSEQRVAAVIERAAAEEEAAEELHRLAEAEARRRAEDDARAREEEEDRLRAAIASARAELEQLRRRSEEEARRRSQAEDELRRVAADAKQAHEEVEQAKAEAAALAAEAAARAAVAAAAAARLSTPGPAHAPNPNPGPTQAPAVTAAPAPLPAASPLTPSLSPAEAGERERADAEEREPAPDLAEDSARRRVAALRAERDALAAPVAAPAPAAPPPPARPAREPVAEEFPPAAPPPELREGNLSDLPAPRLLALAARAGLAGRIDIGGDVARSIWFEDGKVVGASSASPAERVEAVAVRLGLVTREQQRLLGAAAGALPTRRAAVLLLERGFLKPTELSGLVRRRTEEVLFGAFAEQGAPFAWVAEAVPGDERTALDRPPLALAVEGVRRRWLAARVDALLGGPGTLLAPLAGAPTSAELGLSPAERRAVSLADGLRTLDEIVLASPLDPLSTRQVLSALVLVGGLQVRVLQSGRPQAAAAQAIDLARVKDKLEQVRRADYFTVLGVGRPCTPHEVRESADRLLAEFDPGRFATVLDEGLAGRLEEIRQVVLDARDVLADDRLRAEYLRGLGD